MIPHKFSEDDEQRFVSALNWIATEAKFGTGEPNIEYMIVGRNHFAFLQSLLPKIRDNILEVKSIKQAEPEKEKKTKRKK